MKKITFIGLGAIALVATVAYGWRTYENSMWFGSPSSAGDRNLYFEIGSAPTNPALRWDNTDSVIKIANDGSTFERIATQQTANLTASEAVVTGAGGTLTTQAGVSNTEVGYLSGVTSDLQTQLDGKVATTGNETIAGTKNFSSPLGVGEASPDATSLHLKTDDVGAFTPEADADNLIIEGTNAGIQIISDNAGTSYIRFGDTDGGGLTKGGILWSNSADQMSIRSNNVNSVDITSNGLDVVAGSEGTAAYAFNNDPNTGLFSPGADQVALTAGGLNRLDIDTTDITLALPMRGLNGAFGSTTYGFIDAPDTGLYKDAGATGTLLISHDGTKRVEIGGTFMELTGIWLKGPDGSPGTPQYTFDSATDTGMYKEAGATGNLAFSHDGTKRVEIGGTFMELNAIQMRTKNGTNSSPGYAFQGSADDGWYYSSGVNLTIAGTRSIHFEDSANTNFMANADHNIELGGGVVFKLDIGDDLAGEQEFAINKQGTRRFDVAENGRLRFWVLSGGFANDMCAASNTGNLAEQGICSSSKRFKDDVREVTDDEAEKVYDVRPVHYRWNVHGKNEDYGFIAEEMNDHFPELVGWGKTPDTDEPIIESFNYKHYTALLTKVVQKQKKKMDMMETWICAQKKAPEQLCN